MSWRTVKRARPQNTGRKKGGKLLDLGAPIMITGAAAFAMNKMIMSEAEESGLSYQEAAQALGIEITREKLKDLAEEAGLDLAVTLTPIGPLKKAWTFWAISTISCP